jgi:hypothetical protein
VKTQTQNESRKEKWQGGKKIDDIFDAICRLRGQQGKGSSYHSGGGERVCWTKPETHTSEGRMSKYVLARYLWWRNVVQGTGEKRNKQSNNHGR